jgi:beta-phosphoglucomutase-like phosphatase (HAD superfamily)
VSGDPAGQLISFTDFDVSAVEVLLCDADGNLFPSEEPAFDASTDVTNDMLAKFGVSQTYTPTELRLATTGKNFRNTARSLLADGGVETCSADELEYWVGIECDRVTDHLSKTLRPNPDVVEPLRELSGHYRLAAVTSSASMRLNACLAATELEGLIPSDVRFSAEDSLPTPVSKPDPAIYRHAAAALGIEGPQGLAIEDSVPGALSAVGAGFATVGNIMFVPSDERPRRIDELREAGVSAVISSWDQLVHHLLSVESGTRGRV